MNKKIFFCNPNRILAKTIEKHVWEKIEELLTKPETAEYLISKAREEHGKQVHVTEMDRLRNKLQGINEQIEALAEHLSKIPKGLSPVPIFNQMQKLETFKNETKKDLNALSESGMVVDEPTGLKNYYAYLTAIKCIIGLSDSAVLKSKIVKLLVAKVELLPGSFKVHYFVGKSVTTSLDGGGVGQTPASGSKGSYPFLIAGSKTLTRSGPVRPWYNLRPPTENGNIFKD